MSSETSPRTALQSPPGHLRRRGTSDPEDEGPRSRLPHAVLDPLLCQMAVHPGVTPLLGEALGAPTPPAGLALREDLQILISGLARRVAWGGDRRRGSARIELSEGPLAGGMLIVHAEQRSVSVELELPAGSGLASEWQQRILDRLEERGFSVQVRVG